MENFDYRGILVDSGSIVQCNCQVKWQTGVNFVLNTIQYVGAISIANISHNHH